MATNREPAKDMDRRPGRVSARPLRRPRHAQRLQYSASQASHHPADRRLHRSVDRGVSSLRRGPDSAGPQRPQALRRPAQPRHGNASPHPHAVGRGARQPDSHRLHVRLQLSAAQPRRRPLVLAARHRDARRQQQHGARTGPLHHRQRARRSRLHRLKPARGASPATRAEAPAPQRPTSKQQPHRPIHASRTAPLTPPRRLPSRLHREAIYQVLRQHEITLQNGFAIVYHDGRVIASFQMPQRAGATAQVKTWLPDQIADEDSDESALRQPPTDPTDAAILAAAQRNDQPVFSLGTTDYALGATTLKQGNTVVVGLPMPFGMAATMTRLRKNAEAYWVLYSERRQIRDLYMLLLLMMTSLALFASMLARAASLQAGHQAGRSARRRHGGHRRRETTPTACRRAQPKSWANWSAASTTWPPTSKTAVAPSSTPPCS